MLFRSVHKTTNTTALGVLIEDMWANASSNEAGSDTEDTRQALYDGYCDTKNISKTVTPISFL